ncbi:MAG: tetratricopeptide repeat protein [Chitinophagales bacterium]|jgi:tetratricopeptide (TPR) repeat protein|nr:tetratricopeptide repeat protein [Chitinophagales bacterium]
MSRLAQLQAFLQETPDDPFLHYAIALEYLKLSDYDQALLIFEQLTKSNPTYVGTYYHLGKLYEQLQLPNDALNIYQKGIDIAQQLSDRHSLQELRGAQEMLLDELDD